MRKESIIAWSICKSNGKLRSCIIKMTAEWQYTFQQGLQAEGQAQGGTSLSKHSGCLFQVPENNGKWHE